MRRKRASILHVTSIFSRLHERMKTSPRTKSKLKRSPPCHQLRKRFTGFACSRRHFSHLENFREFLDHSPARTRSTSKQRSNNSKLRPNSWLSIHFSLFRIFRIFRTFASYFWRMFRLVTFWNAIYLSNLIWKLRDLKNTRFWVPIIQHPSLQHPK